MMSRGHQRSRAPAPVLWSASVLLTHMSHSVRVSSSTNFITGTLARMTCTCPRPRPSINIEKENKQRPRAGRKYSIPQPQKSFGEQHQGAHLNKSRVYERLPRPFQHLPRSFSAMRYGREPPPPPPQPLVVSSRPSASRSQCRSSACRSHCRQASDRSKPAANP